MTGSYLAILNNKVLICSFDKYLLSTWYVPVHTYILVRITDVELIKLILWLRRLGIKQRHIYSYLFQQMLWRQKQNKTKTGNYERGLKKINVGCAQLWIQQGQIFTANKQIEVVTGWKINKRRDIQGRMILCKLA